MRKLFFLLAIMLVVVCLKPPRNNEFDPDNPNKAYLTGVIESWAGKVKNAKVKLFTLNHEVYDSTSSNADGKYEFTEIDPGIYKIMAFASYYLPTKYEPESLPAGTSDTVDLYFYAMIFNFDIDSVGTVEPFDFRRITGSWSIQNDNTAPSQPNVYNCKAQIGLVLYNPTVRDYGIEINFKFLSPLDTLTQAGVVLRLQDTSNYYIVSASKEKLIFGKVKNGIPTILDAVPNSIMQNEWYNLSVDIYDSTFTIYFNGDLKIEKVDSEFTEGRTGLWVYRTYPPEPSVNFDNIKIYR